MTVFEYIKIRNIHTLLGKPLPRHLLDYGRASFDDLLVRRDDGLLEFSMTKDMRILWSEFNVWNDDPQMKNMGGHTLTVDLETYEPLMRLKIEHFKDGHITMQGSNDD